MCREILATGAPQVSRPDAETVLLPIKRGEWTHDQLIEFEQQTNQELEQLYRTSTLQHSPQRKAIERLGIELVADWFGWDGWTEEDEL